MAGPKDRGSTDCNDNSIKTTQRRHMFLIVFVNFQSFHRSNLLQKTIKLVGTSIFTPLWRPLCCRLIRYTTTLQSIRPPKIFNKMHEIQRLILHLYR